MKSRAITLINRRYCNSPTVCRYTARKRWIVLQNYSTIYSFTLCVYILCNQYGMAWKSSYLFTPLKCSISFPSSDRCRSARLLCSFIANDKHWTKFIYRSNFNWQSIIYYIFGAFYFTLIFFPIPLECVYRLMNMLQGKQWLSSWNIHNSSSVFGMFVSHFTLEWNWSRLINRLIFIILKIAMDWFRVGES